MAMKVEIPLVGGGLGYCRDQICLLGQHRVSLYILGNQLWISRTRLMPFPQGPSEERLSGEVLAGPLTPSPPPCSGPPGVDNDLVMGPPLGSPAWPQRSLAGLYHCSRSDP